MLPLLSKSILRYFAAHFGYIFEKPKIFSWCFAQNFLILVTIGSLKKLFLPLFGTCWSNFLYILEHVPPIVGNHLIYIWIFVLSFFFEKLSISVVTNEVRHTAMSAIRICAPVYANMFICASWFIFILDPRLKAKIVDWCVDFLGLNHAP